jgi:hypothetical protein
MLQDLPKVLGARGNLAGSANSVYLSAFGLSGFHVSPSHVVCLTASAGEIPRLHVCRSSHAGFGWTTSHPTRVRGGTQILPYLAVLFSIDQQSYKLFVEIKKTVASGLLDDTLDY